MFFFHSGSHVGCQTRDITATYWRKVWGKENMNYEVYYYFHFFFKVLNKKII